MQLGQKANIYRDQSRGKRAGPACASESVNELIIRRLHVAQLDRRNPQKLVTWLDLTALLNNPIQGRMGTIY